MDNVGETARAEGGKLIRRILAEKIAAHPAAAAIVTGDFNSFEDAPGYLNLAAPAKADGVTLVDVYRKVHPTVSPDERTIHDFKGSITGRRIDFILASPHFAPVDATIDRTREGNLYPSDHYPVVASLQIMPALPRK
jgi:endonuclease/exonuclease/phosphatase family metal-dependent hydrolase